MSSKANAAPCTRNDTRFFQSLGKEIIVQELLDFFDVAIENRNIQEIGPWWAEEENPITFTLADVTSARVIFIDFVRGVEEPCLCLVFKDGTSSYARL